jgi:hypothetical protein
MLSQSCDLYNIIQRCCSSQKQGRFFICETVYLLHTSWCFRTNFAVSSEELGEGNGGKDMRGVMCAVSFTHWGRERKEKDKGQSYFWDGVSVSSIWSFRCVMWFFSGEGWVVGQGSSAVGNWVTPRNWKRVTTMLV